MAINKICTRCKERKPLDEFNRMSKSPDGRQKWCNGCRSEYRISNRESKAAYDRARYEADPERHRTRARESRRNNPDYLTKYNRAYYQKNSKKIATNVQKWQQDNPDKSRAIKVRHKAAKRNAAGYFTDADIQNLLRSQHGHCVYCKCDITGSYTVDHITPLSRGGTNWPDNLQLVCASCNSSKKDKTHEEYVVYLRATTC